VEKVRATIETTGTVQPDLEGGAKIVSPLAGTVEKIFVRVGDAVRRGTPLAAVRSSDVSDAHAGYLSAQAQMKQAERSYNLNKKLFDIGAVTKNDLLTSETNLKQSRAIIEGVRKKLDIYGSSADGSGMRDTLIIKAPIDGRVVDIAAHIGDRSDAATPLMTVANPAKSLIVANIYDTDIGKFGAGKEVTFTCDVFPDETFKGLITYVSDVEDLDSKTIKTYIRPTAGKSLKQNMFLKISIQGGEWELPVIPKSSLIYKEGKFYVRLKTGGEFRMKEVKTIRDISDKMTAVAGLHKGDIIATAAIDLEQP
jgi:cobalt-zinc-cadmium efflux system membrane fusion protein